MFKSITYVNYDPNFDHHIYKLIDDDFTCTTSIALNGKSHVRTPERVIIIEYQARNLHVHKNLALYYRTLSRPIEYLIVDRNWLDKYYPELEYGKKYYPCILRQFKMLQYGRKVIEHATSTT